MLTIIHGDDTQKSRDHLNQIRAHTTNREIRSLEGRSLEEHALIQALQSQSMFGGDLSIFIDRLFGSLGKKTKQIAQYATILTQASTQVDIIVWEDRELSAGTLKLLAPKAAVHLFKMPVVLFC